jgi:oligoendopeptidase F
MPTPTAPFVAADFDASDFAHIEPLGRALLERPIDSAAALRRWVVDAAELFEFVDEYGTRKSIDNACHTEDAEKEAAYLHYLREVSPKLQPLMFELQKKFVASPFLPQLDESQLPGAKQMRREWKADIDIYREENIPLFTEMAELSKDYGKVTGGMTVDFRGQDYTLQQMARFQEETDRATRQEGWELVTQRRLRDRESLDELFEKLLGVRRKIAANAGFDNYRSYTWIARKRFDYSPEDCLEFGRTVERVVMPLIADLDKQRRTELKVDKLRPWDGLVDVKGRQPLRPFDEKDIDGFVSKTREVFGRFSPEFASQFESLRTNGNLDLASRKGKRPGGFQASLERAKQPFVFMNAAGTQRDVETLLHEGGHAFHAIASFKHPLFVRSAPIEFCEVASMSMELLADDHLGVYYKDGAEAQRAKRVHLEGVIRLLPWVATIDGFQHWLYTHEGHTRSQRTAAWMGLMARFGGGVTDWTGYEAAREAMWQRQVHLYSFPFYYIEYAIAQLGALGVWFNYQKNAAPALKQLRDAFALGGTRPLPELFETAGVRFDFSEAAIGPLVEAVRGELAKLPA